MNITLEYQQHEVKAAEDMYFTIGEQLQARQTNFTVKQNGDCSLYEVSFVIPDEHWDCVDLEW